MATYNQQFNPAFLAQNLSANQEDLLMVALQSNGSTSSNIDLQSSRHSLDFTGSLDPQVLSNTETDGLYQNFQFDPQFLDILDANGESLDVDFEQEEEGSPDGDIDPSAIESNELDHGEKRKSMADSKQDSDEGETGSKRREGDEKQAKKPGRKPLTSEPTSKRKAQNRAAQRAFRERKEKHLKDLETKVEELEKTSESTTQENGLLRAQVERLQSELRDYRKRLSMQSTLTRSPPNLALGSFSSAATNNAINAFNFDFPRFGSQSGSFDSSLAFGNDTLQASPQSTAFDLNTSNGFLSRHTSTDGTSPHSNQVNTPASSDAMRSQHGSISKQSPTVVNGSPGYASDVYGYEKPRNGSIARVSSDSPGSYNIFTSPTTAEPTSYNQNNSEAPNSQSRLFQFNPTSSASPSASSSSHYSTNGTSSSCGTSPEPTTVNKEPTLNTIDEKNKQQDFTEQLRPSNTSKNNIESSSKDAAAVSNGVSEQGVGAFTANSNPFPSFGNDFDMFSASLPEYPDSNTGGQGDGSFGGTLFNDAPSIFDFATPMNWNDLTGSGMRTGLTPGMPRSNPFESFANPLSNIKEEHDISAENKPLACNKIWDTIQQRPDFKAGDLDIDNLCSELRKKAKCSETGVVIDQRDVDAALQRQLGPRS